jgi:hypothetical protein
MIGLFGKYSVYEKVTTTSRINGINSDFSYANSIFPWLGNNAIGLFEYDPANAGALPNEQNLISSSIIAFNADARLIPLPTGQAISASTKPVEFLFKYAAGQRRLRYTGGSVTRIINTVTYRPELIYTYSRYTQSVIQDVPTDFYVPYFINCEHLTIGGSSSGPTNIYNQWPVKLKFLSIGSTTLTSVQQPFPSTLTGFQYVITVASAATQPTEINRLLAGCSSLVYLLFGIEIVAAGNQSTTPIQAGTIDISHMSNLRVLQMRAAGPTEILFSTTQLDNLALPLCTGLPASTVLALLNITLSSATHYYINIESAAKQFTRYFDDTDFKSTLKTFRIYRNYIYGNLTLTTPVSVLLTFLTGNNGNLTDAGAGKNATASSAAAGALSLEFGGAGGTGGTNANGATGSVYGGGGGGAGRTSGTRLGGAGANGHIRITWKTAGAWVTQSFTSSSSISTPSDVTEVFVECTGAGGSGGTRGTTTGGSGGGGGGAWAYAKITVTASTSYNYTVGTGGAAGSGSVPADGFDGGDTYWDAGVDCKAAGGKKGLATQTGGAGGAIVDCVGLIKKAGGNGSTKSSNTSPGGGGGGAAGSTGLKNLMPYVDVTGLTNATTIDLSNSQILDLELPVNTVCTVLTLGGNRLDTVTNPNLISQITAMTALLLLELGTGSGNTLVYSSAENGQDSVNGLGNNRDFSALTVLTTFVANKCGLTGTLTLPSTVQQLICSDNAITAISASSFSSVLTWMSENCPNLVFDYSQLASVSRLNCGFNTSQVTVDLSNRTSTSAWGEVFFKFQGCSALTTIIFPTTQARLLLGVSGSSIFTMADCPLLTTVTNIENCNYDNIASTAQRRFTATNVAVANFKFGINAWLPTLINIENSSMSVVNVDLNLWNIINNRTKWNTTTATKSINIAGSNGTPTGTYAAPTGYRTHAALTVTAVTKAAVGVVTVSSIGTVANGDVVYFYDCTGMTELNGNYYKVSNKSGNTFELETPAGVDVDTTAYGTYTGSAGRCRPDGDLSGGTDTKAGTYVLVTQYGWTITQN